MLEAERFQRRLAFAIMGRGAPHRFRAPGFQVYRNTWMKGLLDALEANYPVIAQLLGAETFSFVATEYVRIHRSTSPVLALYGEKFPAHLAGHPLSDDLSYLADVARLERLWTECFFAPDAPTLRPQDYASLTPVALLGLRPRLHPAARIARFETPAATIWQAHRKEGEFEEIEPEWKAERALVSRCDASVTVTLLDESAYKILTEIRNGQTLGLAIAEAADAHPGSDLAGAVATIIERGALTGAGKERD